VKRRIALAITLTLTVYGFAGWVYIAVVALVEPDTLSWQLTHFAPYPREDTFGEVCFVISLVSFFIYSLLRSSRGKDLTLYPAWRSVGPFRRTNDTSYHHQREHPTIPGY
jgi:hypothetical protein